jgi:hypothetical protein
MVITRAAMNGHTPPPIVPAGANSAGAGAGKTVPGSAASPMCAGMENLVPKMATNTPDYGAMAPKMNLSGWNII